MFRRGLNIAGAVLAGLGAVGCFNTEADFQALLEENNTLTMEVAEAHQENEILARALEDIKREQEALQLLLNAGKSNLNAGRTSPPQAAAAGGEAPGRWEDEWQTPQPGGAPAAPAPAVAPSPTAPAPAVAPSPAAPAPAVAPAPTAPASAVAPAPAAPAQPQSPAPAPPRAAAAPVQPRAAAPAAPAPAARYYLTKSGDVLSNIARANNTTVAKLLELNPSLRNRRNYMIYDQERLRLP